jgi:hypothetical protein
MSNKFATAALAAVLSVSAAVPAAYADRGHGRHHNGHHAYNDRGDHHRGRGHWRNGKWIALGILGAAAAAAAADDYRDCYWRHGRRYCY